MADIEDESGTGIEDESGAPIEDEAIYGGYGGEITPAGEYSKRSELNRGVTGDI